MTTMAGTFDETRLRRGIEGRDADMLISLYNDDAEVEIVDHTNSPSNPLILRGRDEIRRTLEDVCARDMTHSLDRCVVYDDLAAYTESCRYPDGTCVLCNSMLDLEDGRISRHLMVQAWDE
ncbi:nuclear transport factor 2 family protein [Marinactinospora rubrisoli]|uniref:Nuclear transport factor 2 family protein n=1 Tax=Marinactinospora rubrisoli TaxID=2715399 RepID=A0ABW2KFU1_9ACTN